MLAGARAIQFDLQPFVERLTARSRLSEAEQEALLGLPTEVSNVEVHRDLVRLGATVDHVTVVAEGVVARFGQNAEGERQITALHIAGDAPDLHLVVVPRDSCPLQALSSTTILRIPHTALREVAARHPAVAEALWRHCSADAAITAQWVVNLGRRDAQARMAHLLCEMAARADAQIVDGKADFFFPLTQTHLADATGLTPVHVNRTLRALAEQGLVRLSDRRSWIIDWEGLVKRGEFDPGYLRAGLQPGERLRIIS